MHVCEGLYTWVQAPTEVSRGCHIPWSWNCRYLWANCYGRWESSPLEKAVRVLNHWCISLATTLPFWDRVEHSPGWPWSCFVAEGDIELRILLLPVSECWYFRHLVLTFGLGSAGDWTRNFIHARWTLYQLSYTSLPSHILKFLLLGFINILGYYFLINWLHYHYKITVLYKTHVWSLIWNILYIHYY